MSEGQTVGPVWWGFVGAGTEHASVAGRVFGFYLCTDPLPRGHGWDGEAASCRRCRPVPARADMGPVCCKPNSLKKQHLQGNWRQMMALYLITAEERLMEAGRLLSVGLPVADLSELVSTAAHDGWTHKAGVERGCKTQHWCVLHMLFVVTSSL